MHNLNTRTALVAVLDADAPANTARYDRLREPDVFDPEEGIFAWTTPDHDLVVTVPMESFDDFRAYMKARGLAPIGRTVKFRFFEFGAPVEPTFDRLAKTVLA
jgi:hypothetical protein